MVIGRKMVMVGLLKKSGGVRGRQERGQEELLVAGSLRELVPEDHIWRRVDRVVDLSWVREEVKGCYQEYEGRRRIDPEASLSTSSKWFPLQPSCKQHAVMEGGRG
jgi:hypothetical protein